MKSFRCYQLSINFYAQVQSVALPAHLRSQLLRAASSISLNLAEGWGRTSAADRKHFFTIAFGSTRECQAILSLVQENEVIQTLDSLAASLHCLIKKTIT